MPIADIIYNSDIARRPKGCGCENSSTETTTTTTNSKESTCDCGNSVWFVTPPKPLDYPPYPPYGYPCVPPTEPVPMKKSSVEAQICKLSKKAAAIKKMIENFTEKNKDAIIKIGDASYNFGSYVTITKDENGQKVEEESVYGETILTILTDELAAIKEKMQELAAELDEEEIPSTSGTEKTVTQG